MRKVARTCSACHALQPRTEAPDPCLGCLPGVQNACCGHGNRFFAYVMFSDPESEYDWEEKRTVRGDAAHLAQWELGGRPAPFTRDAGTGPTRGRGWVPVLPAKEPSHA